MIPLNHRSVGRISLYIIHMNEKVDTHTHPHTHTHLPARRCQEDKQDNLITSLSSCCSAAPNGSSMQRLHANCILKVIILSVHEVVNVQGTSKIELAPVYLIIYVHI